MNISYLTWSLKSGILEQLSWWFWLGVSLEVVLMMPAGTALSGGLTGVEGPFPRRFIMRCLLLAGGLSSSMQGPSASCLSVLVVLQPASSRSSDPRQQNSSQMLLMTTHWKAHSVFPAVSWLALASDRGDAILEGGDHWGLAWRLASTCFLWSELYGVSQFWDPYIWNK